MKSEIVFRNGVASAPPAAGAASPKAGALAAILICFAASLLVAGAQAPAQAPSPMAAGFTCVKRDATVTPPMSAPPVLQSDQTDAQERPRPLHLQAVCPEGQVPVPTVHDTRYFHKGNPLLGPYWAPGPAHALPAEFVNKHLLRTFDQIHGGTGPTEALPQPQAVPPQPACDGVAYYDSCYYYGNAYEYVTADGGGMTFDVEAPLNFEGEDGGHTIDEIAVEKDGGSDLTDVEMGWSVSFDQWGDTDTHLFVYHWINGAETCYDACNWQQYSSTYAPGMSLSALVGTPVYMGWVHANSAWWAWFNDEWLGYFNDTEWSGGFTQAGLIQWYGEVASSNGVPPRSQMGNGLFAEKTASATMATMCSANASKWICSYDDGQSAGATVPSFYDIESNTSYGAARYGGPGATATAVPEVVVTPASNTITSSESLAVTVTVSYGTGNPSPTGAIVLTGGSYTSASTALSLGTAEVTVPGTQLAAGANTLKATYTPDATSAPTYSGASGTAVVTVTTSKPAPEVSVKPKSLSIVATEALLVTATVHAASGDPTPTGTAKLTSGTYSSKAITLSSGVAAFTIPGKSLPGGADKLTVTYVPNAASSTIYSKSTGTSTVTVTKAVQSIAFPVPAPVTYGAAPIALKAKASSDLPVTYSVISGPATVSDGKLTITGAGAVMVKATQAGNAYYKPAEKTITFTVAKAKLTVTANNLTMAKGAAVPKLTYKMTGFVNKDTQAKATTGQPSLTTTATSSSGAGSYPITAAVGTLAAKNYVFAFVDGTLTVTP